MALASTWKCGLTGRGGAADAPCQGPETSHLQPFPNMETHEETVFFYLVCLLFK